MTLVRCAAPPLFGTKPLEFVAFCAFQGPHSLCFSGVNSRPFSLWISLTCNAFNAIIPAPQASSLWVWQTRSTAPCL